MHLLPRLGLTRETRFCGEASALVARDVMAAQWRQVLLSGWPVFQVFEVLSRWASPHLDVEAAETSLHGRAARGIARHMRSKCDEAEGGAMRAAREVLGPLWRAAEVQSREAGAICGGLPLERTLRRCCETAWRRLPSASRVERCCAPWAVPLVCWPRPGGASAVG